MTKIFKKIIYNTFGVASITNEKFKELLEDLIQNSQFTEEEGNRIVDSFLFDIRHQVDTVNGSIKLKIDELLEKLGVPAVQTMKNEIENYIREVKEDPSLLLKLPSKK